MQAPSSAAPFSHARARARSAAPLGLAGALLVGCATGGGSGSGADTGLFDRAMQALGLSKPAVPDLPVGELPNLPRKVALRLHAGDVLNTDAAGRSLSVVARVYKLRDSTAFLQAPYDSLQLATPGKDAPFAQDVVETREVVLTPGTRHEVVETVPAEAKFVAVVALFRAPADARWRFVFETRAAAASGLTLGLHSCAMSVAQGQPVGATLESQRLAGVQCK